MLKLQNAIIIATLSLAVTGELLAEEQASATRPNIVFMLADDQSWNGLSVNMHPTLSASKSRFFQTPRLERFASEGMRFSSAYAPAPVCSPTRCSIQTGMTTAKNRWTKASRPIPASAGYKLIPPQSRRSLSDDVVTLGESLHAAGYATAHLGKWHLEGGGPGRHGYDMHDGNLGNEYAPRYRDPNPVDIFGMVERAERFMTSQSEKKTPFFIQLSWHALHAPENALKSTIEKYRSLPATSGRRDPSRAAITENLDTGVGKLLDAIDRLGLSENTYVIYTSDNGHGGGKERGSLSGGKGSVREGGIRVPFIIRGPGIEKDSWCHTPIVLYDMYPTFCQWAGAKTLPSGLEGASIIPLLKNPKQTALQRPTAGLVFHFPHYQSYEGPQSAIRSGDWKLIRFFETDRVALFNLDEDISERNDLAEQNPERTEQLKNMLASYLKNVNANMPEANPQYDPAKQPELRRKRRRR